MTEPPSRHLIVLRHAKSAWPEVNDRDRPLAERGRRDAVAAGSWLRHSAYVLDRVICSPARRTQDTWELVRRELGTEPPVDFEERVYEASGAELLQAVREVPPGSRTLLLVGHQPGVQELTLSLVGGGADDALARAGEKFPTSAIAVLRVSGPWSVLAPGCARLTEFVVPRGRRR